MDGVVDPDARPRCQFDPGDRARRRPGQAVGSDRLRVDPSLDRPAPHRGRFGQPDVGQAGARRQPQLGLHEIDAGHLFGDRVLDLDPGIGFDEPEPVVGSDRFTGGGRGVDQEFDGADPAVADRSTQRGSSIAHRRSLPIADAGGRGELDDLLVPALHAAIPFAEVDHIGAVAGDLDLDVMGCGHQLLDVEVAEAERGGRLRLAPGPRLLEVVGVGDRPHAPAPTPGDGFEHHRAVDLEQLTGLLYGGRTVAASENGNARVDGGGACAGLVPEELQLVDRGAHEHDARLGAGGGEVGVLGQEAVAGVHGVGAGRHRGADHRIDVEVAGDADPGQANGAVGEGDVGRRSVVDGVEGDGLDPEGGSGSDDAARDLTTVGDQESLEGGRHREKVAHRLPASQRRGRRSPLVAPSQP